MPERRRQPKGGGGGGGTELSKLAESIKRPTGGADDDDDDAGRVASKLRVAQVGRLKQREANLKREGLSRSHRTRKRRVRRSKRRGKRRGGGGGGASVSVSEKGTSNCSRVPNIIWANQRETNRPAGLGRCCVWLLLAVGLAATTSCQRVGAAGEPLQAEPPATGSTREGVAGQAAAPLTSLDLDEDFYDDDGDDDVNEESVGELAERVQEEPSLFDDSEEFLEDSDREGEEEAGKPGSREEAGFYGGGVAATEFQDPDLIRPEAREALARGRRRQQIEQRLGAERANSTINGSGQQFDDHRVFNTSAFYGPERGGGAAGEHQESAPSESFPHPAASVLASDGGGCAVVLERGLCVSYALVEWALQVARRALKFKRPSERELNSEEPSEATVNSIGELVETTTRVLAKRLQLSWPEVAFELERIDMRQTSLWPSCPLLYRTAPACLLASRYRTHSGRCNNIQTRSPSTGLPIVSPAAIEASLDGHHLLAGANLGSANMAFARMLPADYADTIGAPRRARSGAPLPPARLLSLELHPDLAGWPAAGPRTLANSALFMGWGQLINHDLALASGAREATGHEGACCSGRQWSREQRQVCMPILIGAADPTYGPLGIRCHEFKRSLAGLRLGCSLGQRTQLNTITAFVDANFVYGSSRSASRSLRRHRRGLLEVWHYFSGFRPPLKPLLPPQVEEPDDECRARPAGRFCFRSGDSRTNQEVQLVVLHTLHTRQHNRLAHALGQLNPHWPDGRLYHEARHIHIAMVQHLLLAEYLPQLLGHALLEQHKLVESPAGAYWDHYQANVNPAISQAFAAAAFRQGHSSVPSQVFRFNHLGQLTRAYQLRQVFRQPWALYEPGAVDEFLLGLLEAPSNALDPFVSDEVSGHLLQEPGERVGLDLVAINIQRGRDQGVAGYNAFREWCGLSPFNGFEELDSVMSNRSAFLMGQLYESVDDIDLFSGGLSEFPLEGAQLGPTLACIVGRQFSVLRAADRFWFESSSGPHAFTLAQLDSIKQVSLAGLICANSDGLAAVQLRALQLAHPVLNPRVPCEALPDLDIGLWLEPPAPAPPPARAQAAW